jgi:hypothetical protein
MLLIKAGRRGLKLEPVVEHAFYMVLSFYARKSS